MEELELEDSTDTLGRWMAHYIADLIVNAESSTGEEKRSVERVCFNSILALWSHRAELPNGKRPFEELEPVVRAVESLDPEDDTPRYYRSARTSAGDTEENCESETWLKMVDGLDYSAKVLIGFCLSQAARAAADKSREWIKLAEAAGANDGALEIVIRFVSSTADLNEKPDIDAEARRELEERLTRLEGYNQLADRLAKQWRQQLTSL